MNLLYALMMLGALAINIPWFMMIRRRGRIASHSRSRLQSVSRERASTTARDGDGLISANMGTTLKAHVRSGLLYVLALSVEWSDAEQVSRIPLLSYASYRF